MIFLKTPVFSLAFDEAQGRVDSLIHNGKEYIAEKTAIFKAAFRELACDRLVLDAADFQLEDCTQFETGFTATYAHPRCRATVTAQAEDGLRWGITLTPAQDLVAEWVNFPQVTLPNDLLGNGGKSRILWGFNEGVLVENLDDRQACFPYLEPEYPSQGIMGMYPAIVETQCMAHFDGNSGLYLASHDAADNLKGIDFLPDRSGILFQFRHFCGTEFGGEYVMDFPMVMDFFQGDWHWAAERYRQWLHCAKADRLIPLNQRNDLPKWYGDSPVVVTYPVRGVHDTDIMNPNKLFPYINALPHIERLEKALGSRILVLLMHWEGTAPWAPPYVWPPFGGEEALKAFIDALHARGDVLGVYCSGLGWTQKSNLVDNYDRSADFEEKNLKEVMCLSPEQTLPYSKICTAQRSGYDLCPTQPFAAQTLRQEVRSMADAGIDYIQLMDQNHGGTSYFCYSRSHGHPPVPGKWQVDAVKALLKEACQDAPNVLFGCESAAAEAYIPQLLFSDNRFNLNYRIGRPVPLYGYLYHEYLNNFLGNQVWEVFSIDHEKSPYCVVERLAYAFTAGDMLTLVMNEDGGINWSWCQKDMTDLPNQENILSLVRNLNGWRQTAGEYLHSGKMIAPLAVESGENTIFRRSGTTVNVPKVHTSAWEAADGSHAQFLVNYNDEAVTCTVDLPANASLCALDGSCAPIFAGMQTVTVPALTALAVKW